ncbi:UNVERIFIED_ORG: hypothetical protein FHR35_008695 [Microbispora rosea subsp. rosea]
MIPERLTHVRQRLKMFAAELFAPLARRDPAGQRADGPRRAKGQNPANVPGANVHNIREQLVEARRACLRARR